MSRSGTLLLLTNRFPFGSGEEYLEQEIYSLAEAFERLIVLPCMEPNAPGERPVPHNVHVVRYRTPSHRQGIARMLVRGLRSSDPKPRNPLHHAYDAYFVGRCLEVADAAEGPLLEALGTSPPSVVYSYWLYVTARVGAELRRRFDWGVPLVSRAHGYDINVQASPVRYLPQRGLLLEECDRVHPVSDTAARRLRREHPTKAHKISTRRLGTPRPASHAASADQHINLVTCSMIRPLKRLGIVGRATEILNRRGHPVMWTHFGSGNSRYARRLIHTFSRTGFATFRGYVPNHTIFAEYAELSPRAFINVSRSEGVPVSVMEAMACGIPPLATDVGGTHELLGELGGWALLPSRITAESLADKIETELLRVPNEHIDQLRADSRACWRRVADGDALYRAFADELKGMGGQA